MILIKSVVMTCYNDDVGFFQAYNLSTKVYESGLVSLKKFSFSCFKGRYFGNEHNGSMSDEDLDFKSKLYLKKVKTNIIDLGINNISKFEYFITLTFDDDLLGGYSHDKAMLSLEKWIDNQKHQNKEMSYLLVPEFHQSGRLHFHGLVGNVPKWKFEKALNAKTGKNLIIHGKQIYNLVNYDLGFTTISKIGDSEKVVNYLSKYATKDLIDLKFKKRYWYSRDLKKPRLSFDFIDSDIIDVLLGKDVTYYDFFGRLNSSIEVAKYKLPIIDTNGSKNGL